MSNGYCLYCEYKCHYTKHKNVYFYVEYHKKIKKQQNDIMKNNFDSNLKGKKNSQILL